jgi:PBP1b-binding outer membrane lipoprotein LpoB
MRLKLLISLTACVLVGCSSVQERQPPTNSAEAFLSTTFTDEGIKLTYSLLGKLKSVEVFGQAEIWRGNFEALAEADAFAKLTKFTYGTDVETKRRVELIGKSISTTQQLIQSGKDNGQVSFTDKELERGAASPDSGTSSLNNLRDAKAVNEATVSTLTSIVSKGRLLGVRKVRDYQQDNGKIYVGVYQWSAQDADSADLLRNRMQQRTK